MAIARDPASGKISGTTLGNVQEFFTYDSTYGELAEYRATYAGAEVFKEIYARDLLGRLTGKTVTVNGVTTALGYIYDPAGRLIEVWQNSALLRAYEYDANSNRLKVTEGTKRKRGTYDAQDRLLTYGQRVYEYTSAGDRQLRYNDNNESRLEYSYDSLGALIAAEKRVKLPDGTWTTNFFEYLNDGRSHNAISTIIDLRNRGRQFLDLTETPKIYIWVFLLNFVRILKCIHGARGA